MALSRSFTNRCFVDLEYGSDAANGLTRTTPYRSLAKVTADYLTPGGVYAPPTVNDPISLEVVVAGQSGGTLTSSSTINTGSYGWDQLSFDGTTRGTTVTTEIGMRAWVESDGARPSTGRMVRPTLRGDTPFTSLTQVGATVVYKSNVTNNPSGFTISQVLYKTGNSYILTNLDADGAWKSHFRMIADSTAADATIAANLIAAGPYTACHKSSTKEVFVNLDSNSDAAADLSATAGHWSWVSSQAVENFSKIRLQGFTYIEIDGFDTVFGERGIYIDGSLQTVIRNCRVYEAKVHGIACSYSTFAIENILIENCEVHGLGSSSTGNTMICTTGASNNGNLTNVRIVNCKTVRYMLQNPSGATYTASNAQYPIFPLGIGTAAAGASGFVVSSDVVESAFLDVSATKTSTVQGDILSSTRHQAPADRSIFANYPVRFDRCVIDTYGTWLLSTPEADRGSVAYAFNNCKVRARTTAAAALSAYGVRTGIIFDLPSTFSDPAPVSIYMGVFGGTEFIVDIGTGDAGGNVMCGIGPKDPGTTNLGIRSYFTARDSELSIYSASQVIAPLFEQNSDTDVADKLLFVDVQRCTIAALTPIGKDHDKNQLIRRDTPFDTNTSRIFLNNRYLNFNPANFSQANATYAGFVTNVDPYAVVESDAPFKIPDYTPGANFNTSRVGRSGR